MKANYLTSNAKQILKKAEAILQYGDLDKDGMLSYGNVLNIPG
jgi:hypothetical protein